MKEFRHVSHVTHCPMWTDVNMRTGTIACAGISLINPKTGAAKLIGRGDKPRWSPDGLLLTYNNHTTIMVYDSQKGTSKALVDGTVIGWLRRDRPQLLIDSPINGKSGYYRFDVKTGSTGSLPNRKWICVSRSTSVHRHTTW